VTIKGNQIIADGNVLIIFANDNILSGGTIKVENDGGVTLTAKNGEIVDRNEDKINIDAKDSNVVLTAASGIGSEDSLELLAKVLNLEVTGDGSISINSLAEKTTIDNAKTKNGLIDFYSEGYVIVDKIEALGKGNDFVLGANGIEFRKNGIVNADQRIVIVAEHGNIYSAAENDDEAVKFNAANTNFITFEGKIYGEAQENGGGFIVNFAGSPNVNVISKDELLIYEVSDKEINYGTVVSGDGISLFSSGDGGVTFKKIVANRIDFNQGLVKLDELTDQYYADVKLVIGADIDKIKSKNHTLFSEPLDVEINKIEVVNERPGATLTMDNLAVRSEIDISIGYDKIIIDKLTAGTNSSFSHHGGSKPVADLTLIRNIVTTGDFHFVNMQSNEVYAYSNSINGKITIKNSYSGTKANYDINGISLLIDAKDKERSTYYSYFRNENRDPDFRIWSLNGTYDLTLSREELILSNPQLRTLAAFNHNLLLNGNTTYTDSAFDNLLTDNRHLVQIMLDNSIDTEQIFVAQIENIINVNSPLNEILANWKNTSTTFSEIFNINSPAIVPIIDNKEEDENEEETEPQTPTLAQN
jgi:hypothetical protein